MLTRDDLARVARRHGLGLGRTEHEYVIRCLLDKFPVMVASLRRLLGDFLAR